MNWLNDSMNFVQFYSHFYIYFISAIIRPQNSLDLFQLIDFEFFLSQESQMIAILKKVNISIYWNKFSLKFINCSECHWIHWKDGCLNLTTYICCVHSWWMIHCSFQNEQGLLKSAKSISSTFTFFKTFS